MPKKTFKIIRANDAIGRTSDLEIKAEQYTILPANDANNQNKVVPEALFETDGNENARLFISGDGSGIIGIQTLED